MASHRCLIRDVDARRPLARIAEYRRTLALLWTLVALAALCSITAGRSLIPELPSNAKLMIGGLVAAVILAALRAQMRTIERMPISERAVHHAKVAPVVDLLPQTPREQRWFRAVAVTAGVAEEIVYRAFLHAYVGHYLGSVATVCLAGACFGLAHAYQGATAIVRTAVVGVAFGTFYELSGLLLWPILVHVMIDLQSARIGRLLAPPHRTEVSG